MIIFSNFSIKYEYSGSATSSGKSIPATILACWMKATGLENPLYQYFDDILKIVKPYDVTLVLSSCLSSINTFDASDALEVSEIIVLSELIKKAREKISD